MSASGDQDRDLQRLEERLLLEAIHERWGLDFRDYAPASLRRRLRRAIDREGLTTISGLQERVLHDESCMERLLLDLSINVTAMFRDPTFFAALREQIVPKLRTYPYTRIWVAGCSTGEEVYSLAILLTEAGLYDRTRIYATDMNQSVLERARLGVYPMDKMRDYTQNYQDAGGTRPFSDYYTAGYDGARFSRSLNDNVVFAHHNLATDATFNEFHLILCRNVLIYFDQPLQTRVFDLFADSLAHLGILGLGSKESIRHDATPDRFEVIDADQRLFRKVGRSS